MQSVFRAVKRDNVVYDVPVDYKGMRANRDKAKLDEALWHLLVDRSCCDAVGDAGFCFQ